MYKIYSSLVLVLSISTLLSCSSSSGESDNIKQKAEQPTKQETITKRIPYTLVNKFPHDNTAFTEGFQYVDGYIYESTGQYGKSRLTISDLSTGKLIKRVDLPNEYFGEGMTVLGNSVYMLTYKAQKGFIFDKKTLKKKGEFSIQTSEGWGMTNDSTDLIYSDGTDKLYFLDAQTHQLKKSIQVKDKYGPVSFINELEYINGFIYANQWNTNYILKINPSTGLVEAIADLSNLRRQTGIPEVSMDESAPEVLNGIAYDKEKNRILITGKNWPYTFEIKLDN